MKLTHYAVHRQMGAKMVPFAGWDMPVQYTGIFEEHLATRNAAGLFDVSHMGVYDVRGADAASFLDTVCGNDCGGLQPGESLYSHFLTPDADVIDDTLITAWSLMAAFVWLVRVAGKLRSSRSARRLRRARRSF